MWLYVGEGGGSCVCASMNRYMCVSEFVFSLTYICTRIISSYVCCKFMHRLVTFQEVYMIWSRSRYLSPNWGYGLKGEGGGGLMSDVLDIFY